MSRSAVEIRNAFAWFDDDWRPFLPPEERLVGGVAWTQIVGAARAYLEVLESPLIWWCQKHNLSGTDAECDQNGMGQRACRMVERILVDPEGT